MKRITAFIVSLAIISIIGFSLSGATQYNPEVYKAQKALKELGYNPGKLDGLWGKATQRAVERFQRDRGLPVTGRLDEKTRARLGIDLPYRGIRVKTRAGDGSTKEIDLYSGYYALVVGVGDYRAG